MIELFLTVIVVAFGAGCLGVLSAFEIGDYRQRKREEAAKREAECEAKRLAEKAEREQRLAKVNQWFDDLSTGKTTLNDSDVAAVAIGGFFALAFIVLLEELL